MSRPNPPNGRPPTASRPPEAGTAHRPLPPKASGPGAAPNTFHRGSTASPKTHVPQAYTEQEEQRIQKQLNKVLGPEYVSFRPGGGGQNVSYIEGWKVLNLANEVFGFNGWSSQVISVQVDFLDTLGAGRVSLGLSVVVRITIRDGTYHEDIGYGFIENAKGKAVAFEKCKKEAFTDGLKRCLRCFGNVLGNCLYDKGIVAKMQKVKLPEPELQSDDFHRDPLVVRRERERESKARAQEAAARSAEGNRVVSGGAEANTAAEPNGAAKPNRAAGANGAANTANGGGIQKTSERAPSTSTEVSAISAIKYDLDDFDESFEFSDDLPGEGVAEDNMELDEAKRAYNDKNPDRQAPEQVFFTSSKKAIDLQKDPEQNLPVYDHKFVATSVKRTVDPFKSQAVRRTDMPVTHTPSQTNAGRMGSPAYIPGAGIGKRPLGMPPSQRQQPKRHKDGDIS